METTIGNRMLRVEALSETIFRLTCVVGGDARGNGLSRYGFLRDEWPPVKTESFRDGDAIAVRTSSAVLRAGTTEPGAVEFARADGTVLCAGSFAPGTAGGGEARFTMAAGERYYGFGDQNRERIEYGGARVRMVVENVASYIPIPFMMSSRGYGVLCNTTFPHVWDMGKTEPGVWTLSVPKGLFEIYFMAGGLREALGAYAEITGKPCLPPKWSFGLWFICRMQANDFEVTSDALRFRERKLPCDVIGLEPYWMEKTYDYSVEKKWNPTLFPIPSYAPNGPHTFISALKRMGYRFELWLCNDYDLSHEEERRARRAAAAKAGAEPPVFHADDVEQDAHFTEPIVMDKLTRPEEPWFDHLRKFVDQGVDFFKQDGALQVCHHPDRLWANDMHDDEMHNLYPLFYSRQMFEGFRAHTGRRPCCFTPAGWAGLQQWTGTWTGDTGGGEKTLVACLNLALSGHPLVTCDMEVTRKDAIHYGFLMPWAQVNSWNYFRHPWLLGGELYPVFEFYARLRSRLVPFIYTCAHTAHTTGLPIMRPLVLEFPDDPEAPNVLNEYFLGGEVLVSAFTDSVYLPAGEWLDLWTGEVRRGPGRFPYAPPAGRGGGLFLRKNAILPLGPTVQYVGQPTDEGFSLELFPEEGKTAVFTLYDDDGVSFDCEKGAFVLRRISASLANGALAVDAPADLKIDRITAYLPARPKRLTLRGAGQPFEWDTARNAATWSRGAPPPAG